MLIYQRVSTKIYGWSFQLVDGHFVSEHYKINLGNMADKSTALVMLMWFIPKYMHSPQRFGNQKLCRGKFNKDGYPFTNNSQLTCHLYSPSKGGSPDLAGLSKTGILSQFMNCNWSIIPSSRVKLPQLGRVYIFIGKNDDLSKKTMGIS